MPYVSRLIFLVLLIAIPFQSGCQALKSTGEILERGGYLFDVHLTVITNNPDAIAQATEAQLEEEVNILNEYFVNEDRENLVAFRFKSATLWADAQSSSCDLVDMSNQGASHTSDDWEEAIDDCIDADIVDPNAINIFVYDDYANGSYDSITSRGRLNGFHPYVLLDWERLNHTTQSPEEHEMGHAFGLDHVCDPAATSTTSTNIMATAGNYPNANGVMVDCPGRGGLRDIGFNASQEATILSNAAQIDATLNP